MKIKQELKNWIEEQALNLHSDSLAFGTLDLKTFEYDTFSFGKNSNYEQAFFDLASLTKPLSFFPWIAKNQKLFTSDKLLLLNHQAGLPVSGRLHRQSWQEQIESYEIKESKTAYSDFSPLRLMLDLEKDTGKNFYGELKKHLPKNIMYWRDLPADAYIVATGERLGRVINGQVHDDKAFIIDRFCAHAGLFASIEGLIETVIGYCKELDLIKIMTDQKWGAQERFLLGWDTVKDLETTLAGSKAGEKTFGHLGFTGTSMWISLENNLAVFLLTNETNKYWYDRRFLNAFRRELHNRVWRT